MELRFGPRGYLQIDDARITHRNFAGEGSMYNRDGDRNFSVVIPTEEMADALTEAGWRVKVKPPREEGGDPFMFLPVKIKFNARGPEIYLESGRAKMQLDEDTVHRLDRIDIMSVNLDIRPYDWEMPDGKSGRSAYLEGMHVIQRQSRFAAILDDKDM